MKKIAVTVSFVMIAVSLLLTGCGKQKPAVIEMKILNSFELKDLTGGNIACSANVYKDNIFYVRRLPDTYSIVFADFEGNEVKSFDIPVGKGPGEVMMSMGVKINNDILYFYDLYLQRLSKFDLDGNFIDSIDYSEDAGIIIFYGFINNSLYVHSINEVFIGQMDPENGKLLKTMEHPIKGMPKVDAKVIGGMLETDPYEKEIYVGYGSRPFKIERYDREFNKIGEYTYDDDSDFMDLVYKDGFRVWGDTTVNSLAADKDYVYSPHIGDREIWSQKEVVRSKYPVEIYAFSKESRKLKYIYKSKLLSEHQGTLGVIGESKGRLVLLLSGVGKSINKLCGDDNNKLWRGYAVIIETNE